MERERRWSGLRRLIRKRADDEGSAAEVRLGSPQSSPVGYRAAAAGEEKSAFEIALFASCVWRTAAKVDILGNIMLLFKLSSSRIRTGHYP